MHIGDTGMEVENNQREVDGGISAEQLPRFVRVLKRGQTDLVVFEFSIGWPELAVELMLPQAAFDEFCAKNNVQLLKSERVDDELKKLEERFL